jgi:Tol biopolymer transport system component
VITWRRLGTVLLLAGLVGCQSAPEVGPVGGGPAPTVSNETGVGPRASFVLATPSGLLGAAADGKVLGRIVDLPAGSLPSSAAVYLDGKKIYFAVSSTDQGLGFGSDIYAVNVDGTDLRPVVKRDKPNVFYASPTVDAKGNLYVHRREGDTSGGANAATFQDVKDRLERVDLATGARTTILTDAADPTVSPDGSHIIYMKMERGQATDLWIAGTDGSTPEKFLKTNDWFSYLQAPRISPAGDLVMWSSVPPIQLHNSTPEQGTVARVAGGGKLAHLGIPSEIFLAPVSGASIKSIYRTNDDVVLSWSPDGKRIAFMMQATFYVISAADGAVITKTSGIGAAYGEPVWLKPN